MKKISLILNILVSIMLSLMLVNAVQSISLSPAGTLNENIQLGSSSSTPIVITNTGDETFGLTITKSNFVLGGDTFTLNLDTTSVASLAPGAQTTVTASYTVPSAIAAGTYPGSVTVTSSTNNSVTSVLNINLAVQDTSNGYLTINDGNSDNTLEIEGEIDEEETKTFDIFNIAGVDMTDVKITFTNLDGQDNGDEIDEKEISITESNDRNFDLDAGDKRKIKIEIDIPKGIQEDVYEGEMEVEFNFLNGTSRDVSFDLELNVEGGDLDIIFRPNALDVRDGILKMVGEAGEFVDNYDFEIDNDGDVIVNGITFEIDGDLKEESSSETLPASIVSFTPSSVDLDDGESDNVEVQIQIPDDAVSGTYFAEIRALSSTGREYDEITLELKVAGDIFVHDNGFNIPDSIKPGEDFDLKVTVENTGSRAQSNVKITATVENADIGDTDIIETSNSFRLEVNKEHEEVMRIRIPKEAKDGSHVLRIEVRYDGELLTEIEELRIVRPDENIVIDSYGINPIIAKCDNSIYSFFDLENLGKYDEDVTITSVIKGTGIMAKTGIIELDVDEKVSKTLILNIKNLEAGEYEVEHTIDYGSDNVKRTSDFSVLECSDTGNIDIKPIEDNETEEKEVTKTFFGQKVTNTTIYLASGVGAIFALIIVTLFFL